VPKSIFFVILVLITSGFLIFRQIHINSSKISGAPPYGEPLDAIPEVDPFATIRNWKRPDVPPRVGVQIGHYKNDEVPEELERLRDNTGSEGGGKWEWEVNFEIAHLVANNLTKNGIEVDILPTTVPPSYWADVFIAIHADGSEDRTKSGYKFASPWRDYTGKSGELVSMLEKEYEEATGLMKDENISRNMRGYYAFSWWRYEHAIHPMTTAVIAETGFLTNKYDQKLLIDNPEISANAISTAVIQYLTDQKLLKLDF
jgi:N-acetylmuramoyl-L-alanine amidase